jgi:hypothetical protein
MAGGPAGALALAMGQRSPGRWLARAAGTLPARGSRRARGGGKGLVVRCAGRYGQGSAAVSVVVTVVVPKGFP